MKKSLLVLGAAAVLACASLTGCASSALVMTSTEVSSKATVLGTVTLKTNNYSYTELLKEAQKQYPDCQDVVHVQCDEKSGLGKKYIMYGIAVRY